MAGKAVTSLTSGQSLGAGGAFGAAGTQMEDGLAPASHALLDEASHRINLHSLRTPAKSAVRWRITAPDDVDPKALLGRRAEQVDFDVEVLFGRTFPHLGQ